MTNKKYMDTLWRKVRWEEYERKQLEQAREMDRLIKKEERKAKFNLFFPLTLIIIVIYLGLGLEPMTFFIGGILELLVGIYYEQIMSGRIMGRIKDENMY